MNILKKIIMISLISLIFSAKLYSLTREEMINSISNIVYYTDNFPPFSYNEDGEFKGSSIVTIRNLLVNLGIPENKIKFHYALWPRIYHLVERPRFQNAIISMSYSFERSQNFHFIGPINTNHIGIICPIRLKKEFTKEDTNLSKFIYATIKNDIGDVTLSNLKIPIKKLRLNSPMEMINAVIANKADCVAYSIPSFKYEIRKAGYNFNEHYFIAKIIDKQEIFIAFNKSIPIDEIKLIDSHLTILRTLFTKFDKI